MQGITSVNNWANRNSVAAAHPSRPGASLFRSLKPSPSFFRLETLSWRWPPNVFRFIPATPRETSRHDGRSNHHGESDHQGA